MDAAACAVGRIEPGGRWIGFELTRDDRYALVIGGPDGSRRVEADADLLLALAIAYFEEALESPPDDIAATHADIAGLVRHLAKAETSEPQRRRRLDEAVDAIDDGLAADVVIARLGTALTTAWSYDPAERLVAFARTTAGDD